MTQVALAPRLVTAVIVAAVSVMVGALVAEKPQIAVLALCLLLAIPAVAAPSAYWVVAALTASLTLKGVSTLGLLPSVVTFVDIPLAWGALAVALLGAHDLRRDQRRLVTLLLSLFGITLVSSYFSDFDLLRSVLYFCLIAQPFALATALIIDPPSPRERLLVERAIAFLLVIQIPLSYFQLTIYGPGDNIKGSLWGASAGSHVISGVIVVGCIWLASGSNFSKRVRFTVILLLFPIPFLADAKQIVLALPIVLLVSEWRNVKGFLTRFSVVAVAAGIVLVLLPAGKVAVSYFDDFRHNRTSKQLTASYVLSRMESDPASVVFGLGPAETVSRAAFMTVGELLSRNSPLRTVGLEPARVALDAQALGIVRLGGDIRRSKAVYLAQSASSVILGLPGCSATSLSGSCSSHQPGGSPAVVGLRLPPRSSCCSFLGLSSTGGNSRRSPWLSRPWSDWRSLRTARNNRSGAFATNSRLAVIKI